MSFFSLNTKISNKNRDLLKNGGHLLVLIGFWLFALVFIGIYGNFPLNDDWIYAESVEHLLKTGELRLLACAPACITHVISAASICKIFGFSYVILRVIGFAWAFLASVIVLLIYRELGLNKKASALLAICFSACPLIMNLAFSFMTDLPALASMLVYVYLFIKGLKSNKPSFLILSSLAFLMAIGIRQSLAVLSLANFSVLIFFWFCRRNSWLILFGLVILPLLAGYLSDKWLLATNDFVPLYLWYKSMLTKEFLLLFKSPLQVLSVCSVVLGEIIIYCGLFLVPILALFLACFLAEIFSKKHLYINCIESALAIVSVGFAYIKLVYFDKRLMPFNQNIFRLPALGAHTILGINHHQIYRKNLHILTGFSGFLGFLLAKILFSFILRAMLLIVRSLKNLKNLFKSSDKHIGQNAKFQRPINRAAIFIFLALITFIQLIFTTLQGTFSDIDRYYIFPFALITLCLACVWRWQKIKLNLWIYMPLMFIISAYSIAATQDMMAWNRARWHGLKKLEVQGIKPEQIDGGAEYNYSCDPKLFKNLALYDTYYESTNRGKPPRNNWRWWTVKKEDYIASFSPVPDYEIVSVENYWSALAGKKQIYILKEIASSP